MNDLSKTKIIILLTNPSQNQKDFSFSIFKKLNMILYTLPPK